MSVAARARTPSRNYIGISSELWRELCARGSGAVAFTGQAALRKAEEEGLVLVDLSSKGVGLDDRDDKDAGLPWIRRFMYDVRNRRDVKRKNGFYWAIYSTETGRVHLGVGALVEKRVAQRAVRRFPQLTVMHDGKETTGADQS